MNLRILLTLVGCVAGGSSSTVGSGSTGGPSSSPSPTSSPGSPSGTENGAAASGDAGSPAASDPILRARINGSASPTEFQPKVTSYRDGYTVIEGRSYLDPVAPHVLPTVADLTLRIPSKRGSFACADDGKTTIELALAYDSNANEKENYSGTCTVDVTTFDAPGGGRVIGTFIAGFGPAALSEGVFDLPRSPDR